MTKIQHKRSSVLVSGAAKAPTSAQLDYGELAINYSSTDPQLFIKDSSGSVISILSSYAPLDGATFTGDVNFDAEAIIKGDSTNSGALTLNSETNAKYVKIQAPANSSLTSYTLTLPSSAGSNSNVLATDGSGNLSWALSSMSTADKNKLDGIETAATADQTGAEIKALYEAENDTNAFTDTEKTKLSGIATGAEVNVNADWNATSGDAQILNKPTNVSAFTNDAGYITSADGGNAETLDNLDSSQFLRSDTNDSFTGNLTTGADNHITFGPNTTWGSTLRVGGNGRTATGTEMASVVTTDGNLHLDAAASTNGIFLNYYAGTGGIKFGSGASSVVAVMGPDGDLWKGSSDNSGSKYWHAGNDGAGSGLDADNLDGYTWGSSGKDVRATEFYADNWFRNYNSGEGLYNQATGAHWYSDSDGVWNLTGNTQNQGTNLKFRGTHNGNIEGWIHSNGGGWLGVLNTGGQWQLKQYHIDGYSPNLWFDEEANETWTGNPGADEGKIEYHSNRFYIAAGSNSTEVVKFRRSGSDVAWINNSGHFYSPIMYDTNNTAYYCDPSSWSVFHRGEFKNYNGSVSTGNNVSLEIENNGGTGDGGVAAMSFHCRSYYAMHMHLRHDSYFGIGGWSASTWRWYVQMSTGNMTAAGNVTAYSDIRLKEEIEPLHGCLAKLIGLNGVSFRWKDLPDVVGHPGEKDFGIIAQEVEKVFPEVIHESAHESPDGDKYKTVAYDKLVPVLIEAVKELSVRLTDLENNL